MSHKLISRIFFVLFLILSFENAYLENQSVTKNNSLKNNCFFRKCGFSLFCIIFCNNNIERTYKRL